MKTVERRKHYATKTISPRYVALGEVVQLSAFHNFKLAMRINSQGVTVHRACTRIPPPLFVDVVTGDVIGVAITEKVTLIQCSLYWNQGVTEAGETARERSKL